MKKIAITNKKEGDAFDVASKVMLIFAGYLFNSNAVHINFCEGLVSCNPNKHGFTIMSNDVIAVCSINASQNKLLTIIK